MYQSKNSLMYLHDRGNFLHYLSRICHSFPERKPGFSGDILYIRSKETTADDEVLTIGVELCVRSKVDMKPKTFAVSSNISAHFLRQTSFETAPTTIS